MSEEPRDPSPIWGGELNQTCQWPQAVNVVTSSGNCTGTLVHPQVVLTAAHCGAGSGRIRFGEDTQDYIHEIKGKCVRYPDHKDFFEDVMYCILDEPAEHAVYTPPLMGCETELLQEEAPVIITGYGRDEYGTRGPKRWAEAKLLAVHEKYVDIGDVNTSPCHGDSGGPALIQLRDGTWRPFGIVHGRYDADPFNPPPDLCGSWAGYVRMDPYVAWVEEDSGIDITPCHDADGTWNPGPNCTGFPLGSGSGGTWDDWCAASSSASSWSASCGEPFMDGNDDGTGTTGDSSGSGGDSEGSTSHTGTSGADTDPEGGSVFVGGGTDSDSAGAGGRSPSGCTTGGHDSPPVWSFFLLLLATRGADSRRWRRAPPCWP